MKVLDWLQVIMITLKLINKIEMSWWMVFIPTYITLGTMVVKMLIERSPERQRKRFFDNLKKR